VARKGVQEMVGEFLREAAVLVLVFAFLDQFLTGEEVTLRYVIAILGVSGFLLMTGVVAELTREL